MKKINYSLRLKKLGINTYREAVIYMHKDCHICRSEGFEAQTRVAVRLVDHEIIATLNIVDSDLLTTDEASLSNYAWDHLGAVEGDKIYLSHPAPLKSLGFIRSKIVGNELNFEEINNIIEDVVAGRLSDIHIAAFIASSAGNRLNKNEITALTKAMVHAGTSLQWSKDYVVDKHCIGGLPGNRTSMIIVPIVAAFGLTIPKTSSRAITSPAGTADTMEVFCPVELDIPMMQKVVERENGCIIWGGSVSLSPADDILIRVERAIDLDGEGQLVASVLSKKIAAGATHVIIDIPVGPTAKVRSIQSANLLKNYLETIGGQLGIKLIAIITDGAQPIGRGVGPALEAKDILQVLQNHQAAPADLRDRALMLAGQILEFSTAVPSGSGRKIAETILSSGQAWQKFQAICQAQGGMNEVPTAQYTHPVIAKISGVVTMIDNRRLAYIAKLAGAPNAKSAGIEWLSPLNSTVEKGQPLFVLHAETKGQLDYALSFLYQLPHPHIIQIEQPT